MYKYIQKITINLFSKVLLTYKAIRVKQVALGVHWFFKKKTCYLAFCLKMFSFPHSDCRLTGNYQSWETNGV